MRIWAAGLVLGLATGVAWAETPPVETGTLGEAQVTLHAWGFLVPEELAALRLVLINKEALALFVPKGGAGGFAALAVSPDEGFIRGGALVGSAQAIAGMGSQAEAATAAVKACNALRKGKADCAIVLEVAPK